MKHVTLTAIFIAFSLVACKELYIPPVDSTTDFFLVVEGNLDPTGPTKISVTRTFSLEAAASVTPENNAEVLVEGKDNSTRMLGFSGNGLYTSPSLNLVIGNEYRLRIKTTAGKAYLSDYIKAKITPDIDSISWERTDKGAQIFANTQDPFNSTLYYRWDYDETWEIRSPKSPNLIYDNGMIRFRIFPQEDVSICWKYRSSTEILLANSTRLQADIINKAPIVLLPLNDEKLFWRYSVLVRQYALEKKAYEYFELMKKNTENIGSFFSSQPSEVRGNLYSVNDPAEFVIGFITSSTVDDERIFITNDEVLPWLHTFFCEEVKVLANHDSIRTAANAGYLVYGSDGRFPPAYYFFSTKECVDCTSRAGSTVKPSYW